MALVLNRKKGQQVVIGDVRVSVVKVSGQSVSLAIDAPKDVRILRAELLDKPKQEEQAA